MNAKDIREALDAPVGRLEATRDTFHLGRDIHGWICRDCHRKMPHHGWPRTVYALLLLHKALRHRQIGCRSFDGGRWKYAVNMIEWHLDRSGGDQ